MTGKSDNTTKYGKKCPKCGTEWTVTPKVLTNESWIHCMKCEKKAEDLVSEEKNDDFGFWEDWDHGNWRGL